MKYPSNIYEKREMFKFLLNELERVSDTTDYTDDQFSPTSTHSLSTLRTLVSQAREKSEFEEGPGKADGNGSEMSSKSVKTN